MSKHTKPYLAFLAKVGYPGKTAKEASAEMTAEDPTNPKSKDMILKENGLLLKSKKITCTNTKEGRYALTSAVRAATANGASVAIPTLNHDQTVVLEALKEIGAGNTDDVEVKTGVLPSRGVHYAVTKLLKLGLIEKVGKKNKKGVYQLVKNPAPPPGPKLNGTSMHAEEETDMKLEYKDSSMTIPLNTPPARVEELLSILKKVADGPRAPR